MPLPLVLIVDDKPDNLNAPGERLLPRQALRDTGLGVPADRINGLFNACAQPTPPPGGASAAPGQAWP